MGGSDFVTKFYNLEGDTISERKKNFFKLLNAQEVPLKEEDLKDLKPRNYLEKLLEIDIFVRFNLSGKLLNVIKEGNAAFICRILKHPQILKVAVAKTSAENFVNDFLPCTSYIVRMKILKKISFFLEESYMDEIIFWVHKRYGLNIALKILHTGSSNKIKEYLFTHEATLKPRQVKYIFDKDPELLVVYLNHYKDVTGKAFTHDDLFKYIAHKSPDFWLKLHREQKIYSLNVGRRTSKYIIDHYDDVLNNIENYSNFLRLDVIVRKLRPHFKETYIKFFPKNISNLNIENFSSQLLKCYPKKKRWTVFEQAFMDVFQKDIMDNLVYLNFNYVKMFPNKTVKNKWAEARYENDKNKSNKFLQLCDTNKAIPLIKSKINVTSNISKRSDLVKLLIQNCGANKDFEALENVLQYIWDRHRIEDIVFYIVDEVERYFNLEELNENHWNYLNKIIRYSQLNNRLRYNGNTYMLKYIYFLYLNGKPYKSELMSFLEEVHLKKISFDIRIDNLEFKKRLFIDIINVYIEKNWFGDGYKLPTLIHKILLFNQAHSEQYIDISVFPRIVSWIKSMFDRNYEKLSQDEYSILYYVITWNLECPQNPKILIEPSVIFKVIYHESFLRDLDITLRNLITKHNRSHFENDVLQLFWDNFEKNPYIREYVVRWFLFNEPRTIIPYIEKIFAIDSGCINLSLVKCLSHLNLDKKVIDYCTEKLENYFGETPIGKAVSHGSADDSNSKKENKTLSLQILKPLCVLLPTNKYIEIIEKWFVPINSGIENADGSPNKLYLLQCEIAKCFKETQEPIKALPTLMKFCSGDYLQSALASLYSICYMTPETWLGPFIDLLSGGSISQKKHALFLVCELSDFDTTVNMLQNIDGNSISSQKYVFSATLKYFRKNPCDTLLNMVISNLNKINVHDIETLKDLVKIKLPKKYLDIYIQKCWYFIESLGNDIDNRSYLETFLKSIISSEDIIRSSPDLCKHIMTRYFKELPEKERGLQNIYHFVCTVLRYQKSEKIYDSVFNIISELKKIQRIKPIKKLFQEFYRFALQDIKSINKIDVNNNYHIELYKKRWFSTFTSAEMFDEYFLLNTLYIKCKSYGQIENYVKDVIDYIEELVAQFGPHICRKLENLLVQHVYESKDQYLFFYNVLTLKNTTLNCILVLDLLEELKKNDDHFYEDDDEIKDIYEKTVQILKTSDDPVVSVYLNSYIND